MNGRPAAEVVADAAWLQGDFISVVQKRGAAIIAARKLSSALSAANAIVDHMRDWWFGTAPGVHVSMAVASRGEYGVPPGLVYSYPVTCANRTFQIVQGLTIDAFSRQRMDASAKELQEERAAVQNTASL